MIHKELLRKEIEVALIGDYNPSVTAHIAIPKALEINSKKNNCKTKYKWIDTIRIKNNIKTLLSKVSGVWCVPASPYKNTEGALDAIRFVRENKIPFLGTCGGYQHAILEFARNVLGYKNADNTEVNPKAEMPLIAAMKCSLIEETGDIIINKNSKLFKFYKTEKIKEKYHCSYGFNPKYISLFENSDLKIVGFDLENDPRIIELRSHLFFIGTAFQPERSALNNDTHPIVDGFIKAAIEFKKSKVKSKNSKNLNIII